MGMFSGIDFGAFAAGAATQFVTDIEKKNVYYRDLMEKQDDYVNRYGRKVVSQRTALADESVSLIDDLMGDQIVDGAAIPGLTIESARDLVSKFGDKGVRQLSDLVNQYKSDYPDKALNVNDLYKGIDDYSAPEDFDLRQSLRDQYLVQVAKADTSQGDAASDAEDRGFFASIGDMFKGSGGAEAQYEASKSIPTAGGYTYDQMIEMEGMGMPASMGTPVFNRSSLVDPAEGELLYSQQKSQAISLTDSILAQFDLNPLEWKKATGERVDSLSEEAKLKWIIENKAEEVGTFLRRFNEGGELDNNGPLGIRLGSPQILSDLLKEPEEETIIEPVVPSSEALAELAENNIDPATVLTYDTEAKAAEAFKNDTTIQFALVNGELLSNETYEASSIIEDTTTSKTNLPAKPSIVTKTSDATSTLTDQSIQIPTEKSDSDRAEWEEKYGGKLNDDGSYILAEPRPLEAVLTKRYGSSPPTVRRMLEGWDRKFGDTHDPITGYPLLGDELKLELIPKTDEYIEANK